MLILQYSHDHASMGCPCDIHMSQGNACHHSVQCYPEPYQPDKDIPVKAILVSMIIDHTGQNDLCRRNLSDHRLFS